MNIVAYRKIFLLISGILIAASAVVILFLGFRPAVDLVGGVNWEIKFSDSKINSQEIERALTDLIKDKNFTVRKGTEDSLFLLRLPDLPESDHQRYKTFLEEKLGSLEEIRFESIGPSVGQNLRRRSLLAAVFVLFGIAFYVAWAFRKVSQPISSWKYGLITLLTLFHDVIIPAGLFAVLGRWQGVEIDTNFLVALLVIMGFSVHDTIVVFDRIRENILMYRNSGKKLPEIINNSIKETFSRSVNTSLTLVLALLALIFWGPASLFYFNLTILIGTIIGTYSSIFIASPSLLFFQSQRA